MLGDAPRERGVATTRVIDASAAEIGNVGTSQIGTQIGQKLHKEKGKESEKEKKRRKRNLVDESGVGTNVVAERIIGARKRSVVLDLVVSGVQNVETAHDAVGEDAVG